MTFDPAVVSYDQLLQVFWAMHDPTQVDRQGPDHGTQYRSVILTHSPEQRAAAEASRDAAQARFSRPIATEIADFEAFYPAEDYHQRYYEKTGPRAVLPRVAEGIARGPGPRAGRGRRLIRRRVSGRAQPSRNPTTLCEPSHSG